MKNFARIGSLILILGLAGIQAGCTSYRSSRSASRSVNASDFEVVETSTKRLLTNQEMLQLKIAVARYLDKEGAVASGDYYVKIYLGPDQDGVPADWVVVRFTRDTGTRYSLLASYPANSPGYQSYYAYDYYPYGYDHFSRISFQYYDDPFYGSRYYFPPRRSNYDRNRDRNHDHDRDRDRDHDRDRDRDRDNPRTGDRPRFKPIDPVGAPPPVTRTRGDGNRDGDYRRDRNRGDGNTSGRTWQPRGDNAPPREATSERPPAATRHSGGGPATRSELHRRETPRSEPVRQESTRTESPTRSNESYSAPARSESSSSAPARSESSSSSNQERRQSSSPVSPNER